MVDKKHITHITFLATIALTTLLLLSPHAVKAQDIQYHLDHEYATIWINQDGTIDLLYDMSITCDQGNISYVNVGQPNGDFTIGPAEDQNGRFLQTGDASQGQDYKVKVNLHAPITDGESIRFTLLTNVGHMIWEDEQTPENVSMQFIPCWWKDAKVNELHVRTVLPQGLNETNVGCDPFWDNATYDSEEDYRFVIYWERQNLQPNEKFTCGVSFPKEYVEHYDVTERGIVAFLKSYGVWIGVLLLFAVIIGGVVYVGRKGSYARPVMKMETLGIRRGLTAVEASYLLGLKSTKIVTAILYSVLKKREVWVTSTKPSVKLKVMKHSTRERAPLRYYERSFIEAIGDDGSLSEEKLARVVMELRDEVEEKLRGYCRKDTIKYYKKIVAKAWDQVEQAGTAQLASKAYDKQLLWLLLDEKFASRTEDAFRTRVFEPAPLWFWYWYGYHYHPQPTYKPSTTPPSGPTVPPKIPGADFANNIATAVEGTANNIVINLEKFANAIIPAPPPSQKTSTQPAHHRSSCACACAACACVCACVSCACACASGGVGMTRGTST
jgi:hypothetical protein